MSVNTVASSENKYKILAVDDNENNLKILKMILEKEGYIVETLSDGARAFSCVMQNRPDIILLDVLMPGANGFEICREIKSEESTKRIPLIIISALTQLDDKLKGIELGADEFLTKPINKRELLTRVKTLLKFKRLGSQLENSHNVIMSLAFATDFKDPFRKGHSKRVGLYATECAKAFGMTREEISDIEFGAYLHDIGKVGVPTDILEKTDALSEEEYEIYKKHPLLGYEICAPLEAATRSLSIILHHHERYNGAGFPDGLAGDKIPFGAQIVAVADSFDIMTHGLVNRAAISHGEAVEILRNDSGAKFNPEIVKKFLSLPLQDIERLSNVKMFNSI